MNIFDLLLQVDWNAVMKILIAMVAGHFAGAPVVAKLRSVFGGATPAASGPGAASGVVAKVERFAAELKGPAEQALLAALELHQACMQAGTPAATRNQLVTETLSRLLNSPSTPAA